MAANSQPARAISRKRGCSQSAIQTSRRKSAAVEPSFPIPFQRGIGNGSFPFEGLYTALYVQGVLQNASDPGNNVALYVQGGIPDASGLGLANQVALYVQGLVLTTPLLDWSQHFALYVQGGITDASGLCLANQVALYVQGLALITLSLDRSQLFALYVQGRMQDTSGETQPARLACSGFGSGLAPAINSPCM